MQKAYDKPFVQLDRAERLQLLFVARIGRMAGCDGIQWSSPVHTRSTLRMYPDFTPQVAIETLLLFLSPCTQFVFALSLIVLKLSELRSA